MPPRTAVAYTLSLHDALPICSGGGILAESLAAEGADVTGIDPSEKSLAVAREHAAQSGLTIDYRLASEPRPGIDRKSTRLNSSHTVISYAVFCLKKKKNKAHRTEENHTYSSPKHTRPRSAAKSIGCHTATTSASKTETKSRHT